MPASHFAAFSLLLSEAEPLHANDGRTLDGHAGLTQVGAACVGAVVASWAIQLVKTSIGASPEWHPATAGSQEPRRHRRMDEPELAVVVTANEF